MAHWARIDENNIVVEVVVCDNNDPNGDEGYQWLITNKPGTWIKTSYNTIAGVHLEGGTPLRKNYAGIGMRYDERLDAFIQLKMFESWVLDENTCIWQPPIYYPTDGKDYDWDESTVSWIELPTE